MFERLIYKVTEPIKNKMNKLQPTKLDIHCAVGTLKSNIKFDNFHFVNHLFADTVYLIDQDNTLSKKEMVEAEFQIF